MQEYFSPYPDETNDPNRRSTCRLLKRLRVALFVWLLAFIATVIWFSYAA